MSDSGPSNDKPLIGITGPDRGGSAAWFFSSAAVSRAGGHALHITPRSWRGREDLRAVRLQGLILGGGADVGESPGTASGGDNDGEDEENIPGMLDVLMYPFTWGARLIASLRGAARIDRARDELEFRLLDEAVRREIPVLGICRGAQLINVHFGGTLYRNLSPLYIEEPEIRTIFPRKKVRIEEDSRLAGIMGRSEVRVNALHRQGVCELGKELRIVARDQNGIVQAVEHVGHPFILGVQWHPEYLQHKPEERAIFDALCRSACNAEGHREASCA